MDNAELNLRVARDIMGQTDFAHPGFLWNEGYTEDGKDGWGGFNCPRCGKDGEPDDPRDTPEHPCTLPYVTDIFDAMRVVEKVMANGWDFHIRSRVDLPRVVAFTKGGIECVASICQYLPPRLRCFRLRGHYHGSFHCAHLHEH